MDFRRSPKRRTARPTTVNMIEQLERRTLMCSDLHDAYQLPATHFNVNGAVLAASATATAVAAVESRDIGNVGAAGSTSESNGTYTIAGSGHDIWGNNDGLRLTSQSLTGDGSIVARVTSQQNTDPWARSGIMMRESLASNSKFTMVAVTPSNGTFFSGRGSTGGYAWRSANPSYANPLWLKLTRAGNTFIGYRSTNGTSWTESGRTTISMSATIHVGLAVSSHKVGTLSVARFDNVQFPTPLPGDTESAPTAPSQLSARPDATPSVSLTWTDNSSNETLFRIQRSTNGGSTWFDLATTGPNATSYNHSSVLPGQSYAYRVRAEGTAGVSNYSAMVSGTIPQPNLGDWTSGDIGNVGAGGGNAVANGVHSVAGSGHDIWGNNDAFRFVHQQLTGDGSIVARVTSQQNTDPWARSGIMIRESLASNSKFTMAAVTPSNGTFFSARNSTGGYAWRSANPSYALPLWLKLTRTGDTVVGYRSTNGTTWTETGRTTISMNRTVYVGLATTSHRTGTLSTAKFDNVAVDNDTTVPTPGGFTPLFNGQNLSGFYTWTPSQGKNNDTAGYFEVENGMIHVLGIPNTGAQQEFGYLSTNASYANYHLRFQYKWGVTKFAPRAGSSTPRDSGVLYHVNGPDQLWPLSVETQVQEGDTGDFWMLGTGGRETTIDTTIVNGSYPKKYAVGGVAASQRGGRVVKGTTAESLTDWNTVEVIADGNVLTVMVNGVVVNRATNVRMPDPNDPTKTISLTSGRIAFQAEGAEVWYRNIEIRNLGSTPAPAGATVLLSGSTGTGKFEKRSGGGAVGWTYTGGAMTVASGTGDIRTKDRFADYKLHIEFKTNPKPHNVAEQDRGNSGIALAGSYELQVLDSYERALADTNDLGAIYGVKNAAVNAALPAGVWQAYDIDFTNARWNGSTKIANARVTVRLNGVLIHDNVEIPTSTLTFESETPGLRPIILQDHANAVQYRNIWLING
ncbi:MAG TPA: family 16 glycoside hydrolase [Tepidisphaeraceae bacterium]|jgi:regulation of enolase protein 1 (concanavalin A-like superfamily)|nr:family 16 glycoside hydrolase [Tepidisphaeraceae bacterium]